MGRIGIGFDSFGNPYGHGKREDRFANGEGQFVPLDHQSFQILIEVQDSRMIYRSGGKRAILTATQTATRILTISQSIAI
jgi:hypothetical protein